MLLRKKIVGYSVFFGFVALWMIAGANMTGCSKPEGTCTTKADCNGKNCVNGTCETTSGCKTNDDCKAEKRAVCAGGKCQGCLDDSVCDTAKGEKCSSSNTCLKGCQKSADCAYLSKPGLEAKCLLNQCILPCVSHKECPADMYCKSQACAKGKRPASGTDRDELEPCGDVEDGKKCQSNSDCKKGNVCDRNLCWANCLDGLICKTWSGGTTNYCYKPCKAGCGSGTVCVAAEQFAEKTSVCMRFVKKQGERFDYNKGLYCDTKNGLNTLQPARGQPGFGQGRCWAFCDDKNACEKGRECGTIAVNSEQKPIFACLKPCKTTADCDGIDGLVCKTHTPACTSDAECGKLGPCDTAAGKCKGKDVCIPR